MSIYHVLPESLRVPLWGDRKQYGKSPVEGDSDWRIWREKYAATFYPAFEEQGLMSRVCGMAVPIVERVDTAAKEVLEIGPGRLRHLDSLRGKPKQYTLCDIDVDFLKEASGQLQEADIPVRCVKIDDPVNFSLPLEDGEIDILFTFFSLEHFNPLEEYVREFHRVLKPGGMIVGGIPCEGGLAWGLGRFLTTRRYYYRQGLDYDKIICWEHPNFAKDILATLGKYFSRQAFRKSPFPFLPLDFNLVAGLVYSKT